MHDDDMKQAAGEIMRACQHRGYSREQAMELAGELARQAGGGQGGGSVDARIARLEATVDRLADEGSARWQHPSRDYYQPFRFEGDMRHGGLIRSNTATFSAGATAGTSVTVSPSGIFQQRVQGATVKALTLGVGPALSNDLFNIVVGVTTQGIDEPQFQDVTIAALSFDADDEPQFFPLDPPIDVTASGNVQFNFRVESDLNSSSAGDITPLLVTGTPDQRTFEP